MRAQTSLIVLASLTVAGCGGDGGGEKDGGRSRAAAKPSPPSLQATCRTAGRDLRDPLAVERKLPESPVPMVTSDPRLKRQALALRGTRSVIQRLYDAPDAKRHASYRESVRDLIQELDDAESIARNEYDVAESGPRLQRRWRRTARKAASAGLDACARLRQPAAT